MCLPFLLVTFILKLWASMLDVRDRGMIKVMTRVLSVFSVLYSNSRKRHFYRFLRSHEGPPVPVKSKSSHGPGKSLFNQVYPLLGPGPFTVGQVQIQKMDLSVRSVPPLNVLTLCFVITL